MLNNKAAMFGLDARIALAIFAALSVITGAALYKALQESKSTSLLTDFTELSKAYVQYYLDTGSHITRSDATTYQIAELVNDVNSANGWDGPYIGYERIGGASLIALQHSIYQQILIRRMSLETWPNDNYIPCSSGKKCAIFININGLPTDSYAKAIDEKIDGSDGQNDGKFRWWYIDDVNQYRYEYQIMPITFENS